MTKPTKKAPPSAKWTSLEEWNWGDRGPRLQQFLETINKPALTAHASALLTKIPDKKNLTMSEPFSAGQTGWLALYASGRVIWEQSCGSGH